MKRLQCSDVGNSTAGHRSSPSKGVELCSSDPGLASPCRLEPVSGKRESTDLKMVRRLEAHSLLSANISCNAWGQDLRTDIHGTLPGRFCPSPTWNRGQLGALASIHHRVGRTSNQQLAAPSAHFAYKREWSFLSRGVNHAELAGTWFIAKDYARFPSNDVLTSHLALESMSCERGSRILSI